MMIECCTRWVTYTFNIMHTSHHILFTIWFQFINNRSYDNCWNDWFCIIHFFSERTVCTMFYQKYFHFTKKNLCQCQCFKYKYRSLERESFQLRTIRIKYLCKKILLMDFFCRNCSINLYVSIVQFQKLYRWMLLST